MRLMRVLFPKLTLTFLSVLCIAHLSPPPAFGDNAPQAQSLGVAQALYEKGSYNEALRELQTHPGETASYFYNLGTLLFKMGRAGQAVAYLEKANRMSPHDPSIQQNLRIARASLSQVIGAEKLDPSSSWIESLVDRVPLDETRGTLGLMVFVVLLFWTRSYFKTRSLQKTLIQPAGYLGMLGISLVLALYAAQRYSEGRPPAIAIDRQTVRSGPGDQYLELAQLEPGVKIRLLQEGTESAAAGSPVPSSGSPKWWQIRYGTDSVGWVRASNILPL